MNLTDIYRRLMSGKITLAVAAEEFGLSTAGLKIRMAQWGNRMPLLLLTLDRIAAGALGRGEAAEILEVSPREVNKLMESWSVERPVSSYLIERASSSLKWDMRKKFAIEYIAGTASLETAGEGAGVSVRQIRRWVIDLLAEHHGMAFKDLRKLHSIERAAVAKQIAEGEDIGPELQRKLVEISNGSSSINSEALTRVLSNSKGRRFRESPDA